MVVSGVPDSRKDTHRDANEPSRLEAGKRHFSFGDGLRTMETMEKSRLVFVMPPD
jgi:hypothetical protein